MKHIDQWLEKQQRFQERFVSVNHLLLSPNSLAYLYYRLRYFSFNTLLQIMIHIVEFTLLINLFSQAHLYSLVVLRSVGLVIFGAWWGALEVMRIRIRHASKAKDKKAIIEEISLWLVLASCLAAAILLIGMPYLYQACSNVLHGQAEVFDIYVFVIFFQIACQLLIRAFHSGAFALRRVYRPFWSISGPYVLGFVCLIAFWPLLGLYSLPFSFFISSSLSLFWTWLYTQRMYQLLRYDEIRRIKPRDFLNFLCKLPYYELSLAAASGLVMHLESLLILMMFMVPDDAGNTAQLAYVFYLLSPLVRAGFDWVRLFYFDMKRFTDRWQQRFVLRLKHRLNKASLLMGLIAWLIAIGVTQTIYPVSWDALVMLLPFFLLRSVLALDQLYAFCQHRYYLVLVSGGLLVLPLLLGQHYGVNEQTNWLLLLSGLVLGFLSIRSLTLPMVRSIAIPAHVMSCYDWLLTVKATLRDCTLFSARFPEAKMQHYPRSISRHLAELLHNHGWVSKLSSQQLLYCKLGKVNSTAEETIWISQQSAGLVSGLQHTSTHRDGASALLDAQQQSFFGEPSTQRCTPDSFKQLFPNGLTIDLADPDSSLLVDARVYDEIARGLVGFMSAPLQTQNNNKLRFVCAAVSRDGVTQIYTVSRQDCTASEFLAWQYIVHAHNITQLLENN